ncbi:MAG TPA: aldehyde dehydrogenase family protein [Steroidobacteraceae bacterium]|nr:aldehyde dehydrogenase family protein [Steroidobacteraceae bacterium]HNS27060.1 aldehyde dehydrogenase family protein [Steroidobacteraceae bacterium]
MTRFAVTRLPVRVVAAALFDARGRVLIADRPPGKHMAGRWEFPGGKVGAQEDERAALERELTEELGIKVIAARPFMTSAHRYPDRDVELSLWLVEDWRGDPRPLDGQQIAWAAPGELGDWDILEADEPFVRALGALTGTDMSTDQNFDVRNPRSGEVDFHFTAPTTAEIGRIAAALRHQQPVWRDAGIAHRVAVMQRWKATLESHKEEIVAALSQDTGRHVIAVGEFGSMLGAIDRWCRLAPTLGAQPDGRSEAWPGVAYGYTLVPYPLVGAISPWNFPLILAFIDAIPALLAGCAVLVKPSEVTPRWVAPVQRTIDAVPELAAVLAVRPGGRETGEALVANVDAVCFTGSVKTGRLVGVNAAQHFIPAFLELGGKDPVIITADFDPERAADIVLRAAITASGQACQSLERVYIDRRIHDAFVAALADKARAIDINWPDIHSGYVGPFIFAPQARVVEAQIRDALAKGARVLAGGEIENHGGEWLRPTVLVDVTHDMQVMTEETFGPVIPVMAYDTLEEAIALANDSIYGLSAAVLAGSLAEAEAIAHRIEAGAVSLNDCSLTAMMHEAEKNSFKLSGLGGSRMGPAGYMRFFRTKALLRQTGTPATVAVLAEQGAAPAR